MNTATKTENPPVDVLAMMNAIAIDYEHSLPKAAAQIKEARAAVAELTEAAYFVASDRHQHTAIGAPNSEGCGACDRNWRSWIHYRAGESKATDLARLNAALAKFGGT